MIINEVERHYINEYTADSIEGLLAAYLFGSGAVQPITIKAT